MADARLSWSNCVPHHTSAGVCTARAWFPARTPILIGWSALLIQRRCEARRATRWAPVGLQHPRATGSLRVLRVLRGPSSRPLRAQGPGEPKQPSMVATVPARAGPNVTLPRWTCAMPRIRARRLALASRHATDAAPEAGAVP